MSSGRGVSARRLVKETEVINKSGHMCGVVCYPLGFIGSMRLRTSDSA